MAAYGGSQKNLKHLRESDSFQDPVLRKAIQNFISSTNVYFEMSSASPKKARVPKSANWFGSRQETTLAGNEHVP